jgi:hypothetical protein
VAVARHRRARGRIGHAGLRRPPERGRALGVDRLCARPQRRHGDGGRRTLDAPGCRARLRGDVPGRTDAHHGRSARQARADRRRGSPGSRIRRRAVSAGCRHDRAAA